MFRVAADYLESPPGAYGWAKITGTDYEISVPPLPKRNPEKA